MNAAQNFFVGARVHDLAAMAGAGAAATATWLRNNGYRIRDGQVIVTPHPNEVWDEIERLRASAPPSVPCWRCGVRQGCGHR